MGSKRKEKHRSRSRSRKEKQFRSSSSESLNRKRKRSSSASSFSSLKNLARQQTNYGSSQAIEEFDQEYFFRMSKRIQEDFKEEVDKGNYC